MDKKETTGTGKWSDPGVPHRGWICVDTEDLGEDTIVCEMCEVMEIRHVHVMEHPEYGDTLRCGCVCAGNMECDYARARRREAKMRNRASRRERWLSRRWRVSARGNEYINTDGYNVVVRGGGSRWFFFVRNRETNVASYTRRALGTKNEAKLAALDAMLEMKKHS